MGDAGLPQEITQSQAVAFLMSQVSSLFAASDVRIPGMKVCSPSMGFWGTEPTNFRTYIAVRWGGEYFFTFL